MSSMNVFAEANRFEACSRILTSRASMKWKIEDFQTCSLRVDESLQSPAFTSASALWALQLYPNGETSKSSGGIIGIYLVKVRSDIQHHNVTFTISLEDDKGQNQNSNQRTKVLIGNGSKWGYECVISRKTLFGPKRMELLPDGALTVVCSLVVKDSICHGPVIHNRFGKKTRSEVNIPPTTVSSFKKLSQDLEHLYENQTNHDVILRAGGRDFPVLKVILQARSPVFSAMFEHDMAENRSGVVIVEDIEVSVLDSLLRYIYTGKVHHSSFDHAIQLFCAGDKYCLEDLKAECARFMSAYLTINNICDVIVVAETYNEENLRLLAVDYFFKNISAILSSNEWNAFENQRPELASKLLKQFVSEKKI